MLQKIDRSRLHPPATDETLPQLNQLGGVSIIIGSCEEHRRLIRPATVIAVGTSKPSNKIHPGKTLVIVRDELSSHEHLFSPGAITASLKGVLSTFERHWRLVPFVLRQRGTWLLLWEPWFSCAKKYNAELDEQKDRLPPMNTMENGG